jgi:hypothetical protein
MDLWRCNRTSPYLEVMSQGQDDDPRLGLFSKGSFWDQNTMSKPMFRLTPTAEVERVLAHFAQCRALCESSTPLSASDQAEFDASRAREMARAAARRQPSPQGDLGM